MNEITTAALCSIALLCAPFARAAGEPAQPRKIISLCGHQLELMTGDEVKALGFPWTDVPDDQNAGTYYNQGANALDKIDIDQKAYAQYDHALNFAWDDKMTELAAVIEAAGPALNFYRKGASMRQCQLIYSKSKTLSGMLLPDLSKARTAGRLLVAEARRFEAKRQFKEAADNYLAIIRIGEHYGNGRTMIDQLVGSACIQLGVGGAFKGICRFDYPSKELARLLAELQRLRDGLPDFGHAMATERAFGLGTMDDLMRLGPGSLHIMGVDLDPNAPLSPLPARLLRILFPDRTIKKDMAGFYDRTIAAAKKPYYSDEARQDLMKECKPWNFFAHLMLPTLGRAWTEAERCRAKFEMLRVAIALRMCHLDLGVYPDELKWLKQDKYLKELPTDPFSGKPFVYKLKDGEFTVYSVGENMKDDGGALDPANREGDLGFTSKLPPMKEYEK